MKVRLISKDPFLYRACREALLSLRESQWDFGILPEWQPGIAADLWIWDCEGKEDLPSANWLQEEHRIIFVVERGKIVLFRDLLPVEAVRILLKPVRPRLLLDFLFPTRRSSDLAAEAVDPTADRMRLERDTLLQHLLEANLALQEYEQDRTGFLARAAHEFRAPLVAISGYCGLLLDRQLGPLNPDQVTALEKMQHSVKRMTRLANGMLQISMGSELESEPILKLGDMHALIQQAMGEVRPVAESKQLTLHADVTPPKEQLWFEPWQIEQVLVNLLDNACRLTPRGGKVEVRAFPVFWDWRSAHVSEAPVSEERRSTQLRKPNAYRVEVHDTGPGIRHENPSDREPPNGRRQNGSICSGLGLAICRQIISAHKGQMLIDSAPQGAIFSFVLPLARRQVNRPVAEFKTRTA